MKERLKQLLFGALGKDPEAYVVTFWTAEAADGRLARAMAEEIQRLEPKRRHLIVTVGDEEIAGAKTIRLARSGTLSLFAQAWRALRPYRIGLAPVLFTRQPNALRRAALLLAPRKILAYNARLERHHLRLINCVASLLFLRGVQLDRIYIRPWWLTPWKKRERGLTGLPRQFEGRPLSDARPRVAVVSPYVPYPLSHGGAVRMFHLLRESAQKFDIFLLAFEEPDSKEKERFPAPLLEFCARLILIPKPRYREPRWSSLRPPEVCEYDIEDVRKLLDEVRAKYEISIVQIEFTALATYPGDILVEHDVTYDLFRQVFRDRRTAANWFRYLRWRWFEEKAFWRYPFVTVMSEKDVRLVADLDRVHVVDNGVDLDRFHPAPERAGNNLLFIGSFRHFPNIVAYRFLTEEIWPLLNEQCPDARLTCIAGPDHLLHWRRFTGQFEPPPIESINVFGFVEDVRPAYAEANVVVVPTKVSAGTNVKVLEAMAMERAVVSTSSGCAGLGLVHEETVWIADDAASFAEAIAQLFYHFSFRSRMARAAREYAERRFSWEAVGAQQRALYREVLRRKQVEARGPVLELRRGAGS